MKTQSIRLTEDQMKALDSASRFIPLVEMVMTDSLAFGDSASFLIGILMSLIVLTGWIIS